jgi:hypothetical protein
MNELEKRRFQIKCLVCVEERNSLQLISDKNLEILAPNLIKNIQAMSLDAAIGSS